MFAIRAVHLKGWIFIEKFPPFDSNGGEECVDFLCAGRVGVCQFRLLFGMSFLGPCHVHDWRRASGLDPFAKFCNCFVHRLFWTEWMCVFLKDDIVVVTMQDVEFDLRLLDVLGKSPAAESQHGDIAANVVFLGFFDKELGHIVDVSMAISDE